MAQRTVDSACNIDKESVTQINYPSNGNNAHQMITMHDADPKSGAKGGIDMTTDMWIAAQVSGYQEMRDFTAV